MKAPFIPADSFLIHHDNPSYTAEVIVGFEEVKRAFAALHHTPGLEADDVYEEMLDYASDLGNWACVNGIPINLHISHELSYVEINRITFPERE